jgi:transposase-like protein
MRYYSAEFKNNLVKKMTVPPARSATSLSKDEGIPQSTLSRWVREAVMIWPKGEGMGERTHDRWSAEEKLEALLAYQKLTEEERGKFLREKGLHEADVQRWKAEMLKGMKIEPFVGGKKHPQAKRIAALERELRRKEAALAETAALLVLKKKADLIWGEGKDER